MSGDVQPRKRKDKKKKRESLDYRKSEGELTFSRKSSVQDDESSHGVHITKMGTDDFHLHVHEEHGTGGHWCAKVIFFSLMTILLGLVCIIIMENRGISDMDTPLSESRFSNYFDGWVDEHRADDHHDDVHGSLEDHDDEDDHDDHDDEPFEEEPDVSEGDEADHDEDHDDEDHDDEDDDVDEDEDEDENVTQEEAEEADHDDNATAEDDDDNNATAEDEDADDDNDNVTAEEYEDENVTAEDEENVTAEDENATVEDENLTVEDNDDGDNDEEDDNVTVEATTENTYDEDEDDEDDDADEENDYTTKEDDNIDENTTREASIANSKADDDDEEDDEGFDEDEDDNTFDSVEKIVVDNDAAELELLKEKARQQAAAEALNNPPSNKNNENEDEEAEQVSSWASSLTLKIGVGLALALVARLVLLKKSPITNDEGPVAEVKMQRRLTIASPEDDDELPEDDEIPEPLPENDFSEEEIEIEIEEEIEYIDDIEEEEPTVEENKIDSGNNVYVPETFEQLNAMYRSKGYDDHQEQQQLHDDTSYDNEKTHEPDSHRTQYQYQTSAPASAFENTSITKTISTSPNLTSSKFTATDKEEDIYKSKAPAIFNAPPPPPLIESKIDVNESKHSPPKEYEEKKDSLSPRENIGKDEMDKRGEHEQIIRKREVTHDIDYQPEDDDIDYDEDDIYDDEDAEGHDDDSEDIDDDDLDDDDLEGEEEEEEISDVDDTELMNRLEAKYGKLPPKEFESDEDPDDPSWTQIKPKAVGGGPQSFEDNDDFFEQELRRANDEMMREFNYH